MKPKLPKKQGYISAVEGPEDNDSEIELVIELADTMDNED